MLLSRVADALYWIGRYLERAEHAARVIDVRLDLGLDRLPGGGGWDFGRLFTILHLPEPKIPPGNPAALVDCAIFDPSNPESVIACVTSARDNARQVREEISADMWEHVNGLYLRLREAKAERTWSMRPHYLSRLIIEGVHLFQGITDATMGHGEGWQYLQVGRFLERVHVTAAILDMHFVRGAVGSVDAAAGPLNQIEWAGLLRSCSALEAYCRVYTADLRPDRIAEFLLLNSEFPRSVRYAASCVESALRTLATHSARGAGGRAERLAGRLHASLDYGQVDEILNDDPHTYLEGISRQCEQIHSAVSLSYIAYPIESALPA
jgi:uncharacterized alpha-E superfamily protein